MGQNSEDILKQIINGCDLDELIDRLGWGIEDLVEKLEEDVLDNLDKFDDLFSDD